MQYVQQGGAGIRDPTLTCTADCSAADAIYQDVPVTAKTTSGQYTLGVRVRAEDHAGALLAGGYHARPQGQGSGRELIY